jgi:hypothetical protein
MKIWQGYGSEHSMNLVMIGTFTNAGAATEAEDALNRLTEQVREDQRNGLIDAASMPDRFGDELMELLRQTEIYDISPHEMEQFLYDFNLKRNGSTLTVTTDESGVSALLKVMIDKGARVEVYSAHDYPDTGHGR